MKSFIMHNIVPYWVYKRILSYKKNILHIMEKPFTIAILRQITDLYESGDISYGKMVEMLNEIAIKWHDKVSKYNPMTDGTPYPFASGPIDNGYKLPINPTISKMETTE